MPGKSVEKYVEVVGNQLRIRVHAPRHYGKFFTSKGKKGSRNVRGVTFYGEDEVQSYRLNLVENTKSSARQWVNAVPCSKTMKKRARKLVDAYYSTHKGDPPIVRYKHGKRLRGHALAVQLNSERSNKARAADASRNNKHLLVKTTDENIYRWWHAGHGRRYDIARVDSKGRRAGKQQKRRNWRDQWQEHAAADDYLRGR